MTHDTCFSHTLMHVILFILIHILEKDNTRLLFPPWSKFQLSLKHFSQIHSKSWFGFTVLSLMSCAVLYFFNLSHKINLFVCSVKQFVALVRKLDVNLDTVSTKVNSALARLEKKYDVTLALYQRFEK